ncbi:MAG: hypothetical protein KKA73_18690, partial [Chloroflexi bacterium]|nr:hypothetical protein [Chloroflexota bacterium]
MPRCVKPAPRPAFRVRHLTGGGAFVTQWEYDAMDRVKKTWYPGGTAGQTGELVTATYDDARGLPKGLTGSSPYVSNADYNARGQLTLLDFGAANGAQTTYTYYGDAGVTPPPGYTNVTSFQLLELRTVNANNTEIQRLRYGYDNAGNVQHQWNDHGLGGAETLAFSYDALNRLTSVTGSYNRSYQYNAIGNLTNKAGMTLTYPASGPASARPHAVTSTSAGGSFGYDANGNMTSRREATGQPTYSQVFDAENRVSQVSGNGQTTTFTYDGDGARVKKVDASGTTIYVGNYYEVFTPGAPPTPTPTPTPGVYTWQFTGQVQGPFGGPGVAG